MGKIRKGTVGEQSARKDRRRYADRRERLWGTVVISGLAFGEEELEAECALGARSAV
jgi:hypothetical protein